MPFDYETHDNFPHVILGHSETFPLSSLTKVESTLQNHDISTSIFIKRQDIDYLISLEKLVHHEQNLQRVKEGFLSNSKKKMRIDRSSNFKRLFKLGMTLRYSYYFSKLPIIKWHLKSQVKNQLLFSFGCKSIMNAVLSVELLNHFFSLAGKDCDFQSRAFHWIELNNSISWLTDGFPAFLHLG